jgi:SAM-dependent methyltransferase
VRDDCPGCGRWLRVDGGLDLLPDDLRTEADLFAKEYTALRIHEEWAERDRGRRVKAAGAAIAMMRARLGDDALIADVGSGTAPQSDVLSIDLVGGAAVRGDMLRLPLRDSSADGILYAASLHYAPVDEAVAEAARVLRGGGIVVAVDSPIYNGGGAVRLAAHRSASYYEAAGHPALEAHYHPIETSSLRAALAGSGFEAEHLSTGSPWDRLLGRGPTSRVVARRLG